MPEFPKLTRPTLVAVWPGMGQVAMIGGYYLLTKLRMESVAEFSAEELFDWEQVTVEHGRILPPAWPRSRLFAWKDPEGRSDIVLFIGEAQPPWRKYGFCRRLLDVARELGVERVFTFAAMSSPMHPRRPSRVFCAATDAGSLDRLRGLDAEILESGQIGGLNGVLLGVAAERGLPGVCLLGEIPQIFSQFPFPKATLAVLGAFSALSGVSPDLAELAREAESSVEQLDAVMGRIEEAIDRSRGGGATGEESAESPFAASVGELGEVAPAASELPSEPEPRPPTPFERLTAEDRERIERLFAESAEDRSRAYELKKELDRLEVFPQFEDRFLDLFQQRGPEE